MHPTEKFFGPLPVIVRKKRKTLKRFLGFFAGRGLRRPADGVELFSITVITSSKIAVAVTPGFPRQRASTFRFK